MCLWVEKRLSALGSVKLRIGGTFYFYYHWADQDLWLGFYSPLKNTVTLPRSQQNETKQKKKKKTLQDENFS